MIDSWGIVYYIEILQVYVITTVWSDYIAVIKNIKRQVFT